MNILRLSLSSKLIISLSLGILLGSIFNYIKIDNQVNIFFKDLGGIFISLIKMLIIPLIICSLTSSLANFDSNSKKISSLAIKAVLVYCITSIVAIVIGLFVSKIANVGISDHNLTMSAVSVGEQQKTTIVPKSIVEVIFSIFSSNIVKSMLDSNMLQIVFFSCLLGISVRSSGEKGKVVAKFFESANDVFLKMTCIIMELAPLGVLGVMTFAISNLGISAIIPLLKVLFLMYLACILHISLVYLPIVKLKGISLFTFLKIMSAPLILCATTCSSAACLSPNLIATKKLGVSDTIASFTIPLGNTLNMDGTALYVGVITVFLANVYGIDLNIYELFSVVITGLIASIGATGIPGVIIVIIPIVFSQVGIPVEAIAIVLGIDRLMNMARAPMNILGDAVVAVLLNDKKLKVTNKE